MKELLSKAKQPSKLFIFKNYPICVLPQKESKHVIDLQKFIVKKKMFTLGQ